MDTTGFSQVGRYGTLSLMKRYEPATVVTAFGIDSEQLTFGRDLGCSVRLYYPDVSPLHCKIIFEDRKAFLVVLGESGLLVDGCKVLPSTSHASPTTVPLSNNSEIEIHTKRFRFSYPPKELRAALFASPSRPTNRALRLSMIHSAQVFSPRPSKDPRENLRILQSPLKARFKSPMKPSLLSRPPTQAYPEEIEEDIVLVDGDHPRVVEEEKDLVILEDVEIPSSGEFGHSPQPQLPQTPARRRSMSRNTLHRAVLIRSAQRAVIRAEKEREQEEEEEMEVLDVVAGINDTSSDEEAQMEEEQGQYEDDDERLTDEEDQPPPEQAQKTIWRKSLERIWPFRSSSATPAADAEAEEELHSDDASQENQVPESSPDEKMDVDEDEDEEDENEGHDQPAPLPSRVPQTPIRRALGSFMTPQAQAQSRTSLFPRAAEVSQPTAAAGRYSLGGGEARRILVEQPWRVKDIVVPPSASKDNVIRSHPIGQNSPVRPNRRPTLTDEEKKAIQERRRSALREVDSFFAGGIPGLTPMKTLHRASTSPTKPAAQDDDNPFTRHESSVKERKVSSGDEEEDTRSLLDRMKETVEGMKRRRSMAPGMTGALGEPTPRPTPARPPRVTSSPERTDDIVGSPSKAMQPAVEHTEIGEENEDAEKEEVFSLLRPGARDEALPRRATLVLETTGSLPVEEPEAMEVNDDTPQNVPDVPTKPQARSRLLRGTKSPTRGQSSDQEERPKSRTQRIPRPKTPQPDPVQEEDEIPLPPRSKSANARRTRRTTAEPEEVPPVPTRRGTRKPVVETEEPPTQTQRGRKAAAEPIVASGEKGPVRRVRKAPQPDEADQAPSPEPIALPKRGRKAPAALAEEPVIPTEEPVRRGRTPKAVPARKPRGPKAKPIEVEENVDDDPLDSIDVDAEEAPPAPKVKGKRKAVVKEEHQEEATETPPPLPRARAKVVPAKITPAPAAKTPANKTRVSRKPPATAPPAVESGEVDKENTPGSGSGSGSGKISPPVAAEADDVAVKVRVSRTRAVKATTTKTKVKEEEPEPEEPAKGRVMRSRARTRTA